MGEEQFDRHIILIAALSISFELRTTRWYHNYGISLLIQVHKILWEVLKAGAMRIYA